MLCDAGGGTVDLISYTITGLYPKLQIKEAAPGTCGFCGSTYLDERFSKYLVAKLSRDAEWDSEVLREAMLQFDTVIVECHRFKKNQLTCCRLNADILQRQHPEMVTAFQCPASQTIQHLVFGVGSGK